MKSQKKSQVKYDIVFYGSILEEETMFDVPTPNTNIQNLLVMDVINGNIIIRLTKICFSCATAHRTP